MQQIQRLGATALEVVQKIGAAGVFLYQSLVAMPNLRTGFPLLVKQMYEIGRAHV